MASAGPSLTDENHRLAIVLSSLRQPLSRLVAAEVPLFYAACLADSDASVTDPCDSRHFASAVCRLAGLAPSDAAYDADTDDEAGMTESGTPMAWFWPRFDEAQDFRVANAEGAAKLFLNDDCARTVPADMNQWSLTALLQVVSRNGWLVHKLAQGAGASTAAVADARRILASVQTVWDKHRCDAAHMSPTEFDAALASVAELASLLGFASPALLAPFRRTAENVLDILCGMRLDNLTLEANEEIVWRDGLLVQTFELLQLPQSRVALVGPSGVGKTALARAVLRKLLLSCSSMFRAVIWANGINVPTLLAGYEDAATKLGLCERPRVGSDVFAPACRDVLFAWMYTHSNWLLVLDGIDELEALRKDLPQLDRVQGTVLLTTCRRSLKCLGEFTKLQVECLDEPAALDLFLRRCGCVDAAMLAPNDLAAAKQLCTHEFGGLPFALMEAAALVDPPLAFEAFLTRWRSQRSQLLVPPPRCDKWQQWLLDKGVSGVVVAAFETYGVATFADLMSLRSAHSRVDRALHGVTLSDDERTTLDGVLETVIEWRRSLQLTSLRSNAVTVWTAHLRFLTSWQLAVLHIVAYFGPDVVLLDVVACCLSALAEDALARPAVKALVNWSLLSWASKKTAVIMHPLLRTVVWDALQDSQRTSVAAACSMCAARAESHTRPGAPLNGLQRIHAM